MPDSNIHHSDITWLRDADVTRGCNPPANTQFCPDQPVLRQQMASFMRRLAENQVVDAGRLAGQEQTAYETVVVAATCGLNSTASATSCGTDDAGAVPDETTVETLSVQVVAPVSGTLRLTSTRAANTTDWATVNAACAVYGAPFTQIYEQIANWMIFGGVEEITSSGSTAVQVPAGTHTVRLCSAYEASDGVGAVLLANLVAEWSAGGSVSVAGEPAGGGALLTGDSLLGR